MIESFSVMIYKYGGFYLDLDYVVFNDLRKVVNLTSSDVIFFSGTTYL